MTEPVTYCVIVVRFGPGPQLRDEMSVNNYGLLADALDDIEDMAHENGWLTDHEPAPEPVNGR